MNRVDVVIGMKVVPHRKTTGKPPASVLCVQ